MARELWRDEITTSGEDSAGESAEFHKAASAEFHKAASAVTGRHPQTWVRTADGRRIVAAHVSPLAAHVCTLTTSNPPGPAN